MVLILHLMNLQKGLEINFITLSWLSLKSFWIGKYVICLDIQVNRRGSKCVFFKKKKKQPFRALENIQYLLIT